MAIVITCDMCGAELTEPGGLLLSPPERGWVKKSHLCVTCYTNVAKKPIEHLDGLDEETTWVQDGRTFRRVDMPEHLWLGVCVDEGTAASIVRLHNADYHEAVPGVAVTDEVALVRFLLGDPHDQLCCEAGGTKCCLVRFLLGGKRYEALVRAEAGDGAGYLAAVTRPVDLTPADEEAVQSLLERPEGG